MTPSSSHKPISNHGPRDRAVGVEHDQIRRHCKMYTISDRYLFLFIFLEKHNFSGRWSKKRGKRKFHEKRKENVLLQDNKVD